MSQIICLENGKTILIHQKFAITCLGQIFKGKKNDKLVRLQILLMPGNQVLFDKTNFTRIAPISNPFVEKSKFASAGGTILVVDISERVQILINDDILLWIRDIEDSGVILLCITPRKNKLSRNSTVNLADELNRKSKKPKIKKS